MKPIRIFDTKAGKKVEFQPLVPGQMSLYYCGPTVYNYVHLGNLRPVVVFDLLTRVFRSDGYQTKVVSNYTDIDDKIIKEALAEKKTEKEISAFYIRAYEDSLAKLNLLPLFYRPRASEVIQRIEDFIGVLLQKGYAYQAGDDVNFRIDKVKDYGSLSHVVLENNQAGKRIEVNSQKENPYDFALWKKTADAGIKFDSPWGKGRPGWHTECVVMIKDVFKSPMVDIHGGGFDLKFPHHENERAQSLGYDGTGLADYWMHVGFLTAAGGVKMSKSLGNVVLAKDCLSRHSGNALRLFFYQTHYRAPIAYSEEAMASAEAQADKYVSTLAKLSYRGELIGQPLTGKGSDGKALDEALGYLSDDLNVANALTVLEKVARKGLTLLRNPQTPMADLDAAYGDLEGLLDLLGLQAAVAPLTEDDRKAYLDYQKARADKDFATSDRLRAHLTQKGIL